SGQTRLRPGAPPPWGRGPPPPPFPAEPARRPRPAPAGASRPSVISPVLPSGFPPKGGARRDVRREATRVPAPGLPPRRPRRPRRGGTAATFLTAFPAPAPRPPARPRAGFPRMNGAAGAVGTRGVRERDTAARIGYTARRPHAPGG